MTGSSSSGETTNPCWIPAVSLSLSLSPVIKCGFVLHNLFCVVFSRSVFILLSFFFWLLYCLSFCPFSFRYCIVCSFSFGYCIVCSFSFGYCIVCPFVLFPLVIVSLVLWFKAFHYTFGISNPFSENDQGYIPFVSQNPIFLPAWLNNGFLFVVSHNPGKKGRRVTR